MKKIIPIIFCFFFPLLVTLPHVGTTFVGPDFTFRYQAAEDLSFLNVWNGNYLGERNFSTNQVANILLAKLSILVGGEVNAPVVYVYVALTLFLLSVYTLTSLIQKVSGRTENSWKNVALESVVVALAFFSPIVLGYIANYFTISLILSAAFAAFSLSSLIRYLMQNGKRNLVLSVVITPLIAHPPTLLFFLGSAVLMLLLARRFSGTAFFISGVILLNIFWIFPMVLGVLIPGGASMSANQDYIKHMFSWYSSGAGALPSSVFSVYPYRESRLFSVIPLEIFAILYALGWVVLITALVVSKPRTKESRVVFSALGVFLLGLGFSFGGNYGTGIIFKFLFEHVPGMMLFKSFTQVLNVTFLFFIVLLAWALTKLQKYPKTFWTTVLSFGLCFVAIGYYLPDLNKHMERGTMPQEYSKIRTIVENDPIDSRILELPEIPYSYFSWTKEWDHLTLQQQWFSKPVVYFGIVVPETAKAVKPSDGDYTKLFLENNFRYLLVHKDSYSTKYKPLPFSFDFSKVELLETNDFFDFYQIKDEFFTPRVYADSGVVLDVQHVSPTRYEMKVKNLATSTNLVMLESFDKGWKIFFESECGTQKPPSVFDALMRTPLSDDSHKRVQGYANQWTLNKADILRGYPETSYEVNDSNAINFCATIYYTYQAYQKVALGVSLATLLLLGLLFFTYGKRA